MGKAHQAQCTRETIHGQAGWKLTLDQGDTLMVTEQGAHVVSWKSQGREQLFLSPLNVWDGVRAIRGGIRCVFRSSISAEHSPNMGLRATWCGNSDKRG